MELWLDTTNHEKVALAHRLGILHGVTTNPSLVARSGIPLERIVERIREVHSGPLALQVLADDAKEMVEQGKRLHAYTPGVIVKVPVSRQGIEAIHILSEQGIPTLATAVFHLNQVLLAAMAGAHYVAPYVSHMLHAGLEAFESMGAMMTMARQYGWKMKVLAASLVNPDQMAQCAQLGIHALTIKDEMLETVLQDHELTVEHIERFAHNWQSAAPTTLLPRR